MVRESTSEEKNCLEKIFQTQDLMSEYEGDQFWGFFLGIIFIFLHPIPGDLLGISEDIFDWFFEGSIYFILVGVFLILYGINRTKKLIPLKKRLKNLYRELDVIQKKI